jgi:hypothetical protein
MNTRSMTLKKAKATLPPVRKMYRIVYQGENWDYHHSFLIELDEGQDDEATVVGVSVQHTDAHEDGRCLPDEEGTFKASIQRFERNERSLAHEHADHWRMVFRKVYTSEIDIFYVEVAYIPSKSLWYPVQIHHNGMDNEETSTFKVTEVRGDGSEILQTELRQDDDDDMYL